MARAIDYHNFNSFRLSIPGLGGGTFHSRREPELLGFAGTAIDAQDGDVTASLLWTSDLDGAIGTGATFLLEGEVQSAIGAGTADGVLSWHHWFCPDGTIHASCGPLVVEFEVDESFPRVTLATMLGPSPDWFVGVSGLVLHDGSD